jgi:MFS transporter, CP family, cyanate transporter
VAARMSDQRPLVVALTACFLGGYVGLLAAPVGGAWLWAVLVGTGLCMFPLCLTLLGLRTRSAEGTAALSGFTQAVGYGIAIIGPIGIGVLHDRTGSWTAPLVVLLVLTVPQLVVGLAAARPRLLEDELSAESDVGDLR